MTAINAAALLSRDADPQARTPSPARDGCLVGVEEDRERHRSAGDQEPEEDQLAGEGRVLDQRSEVQGAQRKATG
jgi:hypothetical protein